MFQGLISARGFSFEPPHPPYADVISLVCSLRYEEKMINFNALPKRLDPGVWVELRMFGAA